MMEKKGYQQTMPPKLFSDGLLNKLIDTEQPDRQPSHATYSVLSIDPSGAGLVSAVGIVGAFVYVSATGSCSYEIAHAVAVSVDPKTYLTSIAELIHAHAAKLFEATGSQKQPLVFIESIDRVSYTGALFKYMYPGAPFIDNVFETVFFDQYDKQLRFNETIAAMQAGRITIRTDLVRFVQPYKLAELSPNWKATPLPALQEHVRLLQELYRFRMPQAGGVAIKPMDDVVMAFVNCIWEASIAGINERRIRNLTNPFESGPIRHP
jgi:hypothetical protein